MDDVSQAEPTKHHPDSEKLVSIASVLQILRKVLEGRTQGKPIRVGKAHNSLTVVKFEKCGHCPLTQKADSNCQVLVEQLYQSYFGCNPCDFFNYVAVLKQD